MYVYVWAREKMTHVARRVQVASRFFPHKRQAFTMVKGIQVSTS